MAVQVPGKPEVEERFIPHLTVRGAAEAIGFYERAFGAQELYRATMPNGALLHAELKVGGAMFMLAEEAHGMRSPAALGGSPVTLELYVKDVDAAVQRAVGAGAQVLFPVQDALWGDRYAQVRDPFGHVWALATLKELLAPDQVRERMVQAFGGGRA